MLRIAVAQLNPVMGDIAGNLAKARAARVQAADMKADLILFTELFIAGYPPEDLVLKPSFVEACEKAVRDLAADTADGGPGVIIGTPLRRESGLHNSVMVLDGGEVIAERFKVDLPNYGEFDEKRVFEPGPLPGPVNFRGVRIGIPICEDIWGDLGVSETLAESGAEFLLVPNGSPYHRAKMDRRYQVVLKQVMLSELPMLYANQVGGQDELIFDGASFAFNPGNKFPCLQMPQFSEQIAMTIWHRDGDTWRCEEGEKALLPEELEADYSACVLGLRDYVNKNGFKDVVLGLSGGIDSAICAAMGVDALGPERVRCIMLPYRYTSGESLQDAADCAKALGVRYDIVPIAEPVEGFMSALQPLFAGTDSGVTEENLQSRARGTILMAVSNKFGSMVVTTGNKSEMSVGYATLYGDMNGGFNPIKDVYKMQVYAMSEWRNSHVPQGSLGPAGEVIPNNIISKAPSAELRENQTDQDSLPPYPVLDDILECLVENEMSNADIVARGHPVETVQRIEHLLYLAEYKRRQSAPGVKITRKNFGRDRRYPITNRFRDR
ncbi:NAD+ synthase [Ochrobactrum soli]|uniref:Glutamine-dependent NAD(+) synthetase n=2 Tax=Ochrobactrum TaxID=528 RepID=A0ABD5JWM6_9HYPH|nr:MULTISPECIES: NAD+ synthase [Brucella]MCI0999793.1 NAD+ synthase [Ochrobactrum sp. C6C9]WHT42582.1 NAD+ synthase [Ochrobactrum sp. SSR]RLL76600.1 NAD+ synthase [[Ochrobactrum] soli]WHS30957.1 NAD+ synthase [Brucella sp. NM4]SPL65243.1 NAD synthetase / Glutamine amidotransferase chain of NAD synthetase [[Ochrobactrum] soli]